MSVTEDAARAEVVAALRSAGCVFAEQEAALILDAADGPETLADLVAGRVAGRPLEQVLGWAAFCGLRVVVHPDVFVPRRRTELMAAEAVVLARRVAGRRPVVLDLCCGSGALGLVVGESVDAEVHAADSEAPAVACARVNLAGRGAVHHGDLFDPVPADLRGRVDVLVANVPYVPTGEIRLLPGEAREHEPRVTLDGGYDGLEVVRRVLIGGVDWLAPGGSLLVETSERQCAAAVAAFEASGLAARVAVDEELGATVVVGTRSP